MNNFFIPKVGMKDDIGGTKLDTNMAPMRMGAIESPNSTGSFKDIFTGMVKDFNSTVKAPDQILQDAVLENGPDVHDVMIAMSKAEIGVNLATNITTKIIQSYEKVMAIQV